MLCGVAPQLCPPKPFSIGFCHLSSAIEEERVTRAPKVAMEVWSAMQCASAVLGFVDLAGTLLSGAYKAYKGSSSLEPTAAQLKAIRQNLQVLRESARLEEQAGRGARFKLQADGEIDNLASECETIVNYLINIVGKVCSYGDAAGPSALSSLKQAIKILWNSRDTEELQAQLGGY